jgi:hypothetical protein
MRLRVILLYLLVMTTACSEVKEITPAERQYLFFPGEIEHFPIENYRFQKTAWDHVPYIFFKKYTDTFGLTGIYGTILISPSGAKVKYLCLVNIPSTIEQARDLFALMIAEPSPRDFGREETIDPGLYRADEAYLYRDNLSYFHLILRSSRIVYAILLDGARVEEPQVRNGLRHKLAYIQKHVNAIR